MSAQEKSKAGEGVPVEVSVEVSFPKGEDFKEGKEPALQLNINVHLQGLSS